MTPQFVKTEGIRFTLDDQAFPVRGVNCYFLAYCSDPPRRALLETARRMGATVVRAWAFLDGAHNGVAFQDLDAGRIVRNPGPDGLERLDALIAAADEFDLRLVLPFVNYWKDLGGMPRYLQWLGIEGGPQEFYRQPSARSAYKTWVAALLTRRNTRTGRLYAEEPSVMAWELANEPRCEIPGGRDLLLDWIGEMSAFVKSLDRNHLLAVGDEGFLRHANTRDHLYDGSHGVDGEAILNFGDIDFGTYHWYPKDMGRPPSFAETWIRDHVQSGERANKPMLLAEYGLRLDDVETPAERKQWYSRWAESVDVAGGAGHLVWMLGSAAPEVAGFHDPFTIYRPAAAPRLQTAARRPVLRDSEAAVRIVLRDVEGEPVPFGAADLTLLRNGRGVDFRFHPGSGDCVVSAGTREPWSVRFFPRRYLPRISGFFNLQPGDTVTLELTAVRNPGAWSAEFRKWRDLGEPFALLTQSLALGEAAWDALAGDDVLPKAALLNIYHVLRATPDPLRPEESWFHRVQRVLQLGTERILAEVDSGALESVTAVLANPARFGYRHAESPELHRKFLPREYQGEAQIVSIKKNLDEAGLQVTVSRIPSRGILIMDADLDEHGKLLEHVFDGIEHFVTRNGTHPYEIHEALIAHTAIPIDLGYTLV